MFEEGLEKRPTIGPLRLIVPESCTRLGKQVDEQLHKWRVSRCEKNPELARSAEYMLDTYIVDSQLARFGSGEGKATLSESVRGDDVFILVDVTSPDIPYSLSGRHSLLGPDEHYADLKRIISAIGGKARRITVIMPFLYEGRQNHREGRESLDCAMMLHELHNMGVDNLITFDAHDPRVANAIPLGGFENIRPTYQFIKGLLTEVPDLQIDPDHLMVISPDEGGTARAIYMANNLGVDMGMFYRRRDYTQPGYSGYDTGDSTFLGRDVTGKDLLIIDDMISSGDSVLEVAEALHKKGAGRIFIFSTFGLFTYGLRKFDKAYSRGYFDKLLTTDLIYQSPELLSKKESYYISCGMAKYLAFIIEHLNHDASIARLLDPVDRIQSLLAEYKSGRIHDVETDI